MQHPDVCCDALLTGIKRYCHVAQTRASSEVNLQDDDIVDPQITDGPAASPPAVMVLSSPLSPCQAGGEAFLHDKVSEQTTESDGSAASLAASLAVAAVESTIARCRDAGLSNQNQNQSKLAKALEIISFEIWLFIVDHLSVPGICSFAECCHSAQKLAHDEGALWDSRVQKWFGGRAASCSSQRSSLELYKMVRNASSGWDRSRSRHELSVRGRQITKVDHYNDVTWAFLRAPFPVDVNIVRWGVRVLYHSDELRIGVTTDPDVCAARRAALSFLERTAHLYSDGSMTHGYNHARQKDQHRHSYRQFTTGDVVGIEVNVISRFFRVFINGVEACEVACGPIPGTGPLWGCIVMDEAGDRVELIPNWTPDRWWGDESTGEASAELPEWVRPAPELPSRVSRWSPPWIIPDEQDYEPSESSGAFDRHSEVEPDEVDWAWHDWELISPP